MRIKALLLSVTSTIVREALYKTHILRARPLIVLRDNKPMEIGRICIRLEAVLEAWVCDVDKALQEAWAFTVGDGCPHTIAQQLQQALQPLFCFLGLKIVKMASSKTVFSPF